MAKVIFDGRWFDEQDPDGYYETVYDNMVRHYAHLLWPRFYIADFKFPVVSSDGISKVADFALIEHGYAEWWVVEVERKCHAIEAHVIPQVRVFADARYGVAAARFLHEANNRLNLGRLEELLSNTPPRVLVMVNKPMTSWKTKLQKHNALLGVFELFKSDNGDWLVRVDGEHPIGNADMVSVCCMEALSRWLIVESPGNLRMPNGGMISIEYKGHFTEWTRFNQTNATYLHTKGPCPISELGKYELLHAGNGRYLFRKLGS